VNRGDPLIHIEFITREGDPSPYRGNYMFQYMTDEETEQYAQILSRHFNDLFDPAELASMRRNKVLVET
jgi:dCTP deaminase